MPVVLLQQREGRRLIRLRIVGFDNCWGEDAWCMQTKLFDAWRVLACLIVQRLVVVGVEEGRAGMPTRRDLGSAWLLLRVEEPNG